MSAESSQPATDGANVVSRRASRWRPGGPVRSLPLLAPMAVISLVAPAPWPLHIAGVAAAHPRVAATAAVALTVILADGVRRPGLGARPGAATPGLHQQP